MPTTALAHFGEDVARARAIVAHADPLPAATPAEQMPSVGAESGWNG